MKILSFPGLIILLLLSTGVFAQVGSDTRVYSKKDRTCLTPVPAAGWDAWFNAQVDEHKQESLAMKQQLNSYTIPVIVHIIHGGENVGVMPNISQEQINSQILSLNADFAGNGFNVNNLPSGFFNDKADCHITFAMAQLDPHGEALQEAGIERINWHDLGPGNNPLTAFNSPAFQKFFDDSIKPKTIWDPRFYFNIWVSDVKSTVDLLGYATFPIGTGLTGIYNGNGEMLDDGVWIWVSSFGTTGSLHPQYNKGRTATHEIGHWLGLRHLWGDVNCGEDYCSDTPKQQTSNLNCPSFPQTSCDNEPNGEMFMNFMDYCDDPCLYMFTWDQMQRMHTALDKGTYRSQLTASSATLTGLPLQAPVAAFTMTQTACANLAVDVTNQTTGMPGSYYKWQVEPTEGYMVFPSAMAEEPDFVFTVPGTYTVNLLAANSFAADSKNVVIEVQDCGIPVGIDVRAPKSLFVIAPNPSDGNVTITGDFGESTKVEVELFDALGSIVYLGTFGPESISLQLNELPGGVYFASIRRENHREVKKLVLSR
jgi:hypothetical protein